MGNSQSFLNDLCDLLTVPTPHDPKQGGTRAEYSFERPVTFHHANGKTSSGRIDLYRRKSFVLEAKQGSEQKARITDPRQYEMITGEKLQKKPTNMATRGTPSWTAAMLKAKGQAYAYARALDANEGWPPFLIVTDIGHVIDIYADFSGAGKNYTPFPDGNTYRLTMDDLRKEEVQDRLKRIWKDPLSLDPARENAKVTREVSEMLADLATSFTKQKHDSELTAKFLMRCLFTMFAEDVGLIPENSFTEKLKSLRGKPEQVAPTLENLWASMDKGGFSPVLSQDLLHFNGFLFKDTTALPVNKIQLSALIDAAEKDWQSVEPAIFGTLLERALSAKDRHKLGAHFTPRSYVDRLVTPTILEPLRNDWLDVQTAALKLSDAGDMEGAIDVMRAFKRSLCNVRVLDPACGSGNFLYVALEGMKRLEGEVDAALSGLGDRQTDALTVDPGQFLGIELNPWAAAVAELVLWIGYLQWHFRTFGKVMPAQPVLKDFHNIECRDALLDLEGERPRIGEDGKPESRWDGESFIQHPVTGERVPDPAGRRVIMDFDSARAASWPSADFIIGNPPFIGASRMRDALGDGYTETVREVYRKVPESVDFVMYWWEKAASLMQAGTPKKPGPRRFGFITTNSLRQTFARRVLDPYLGHKKKPLSLLFAIPDHPWVDSKDGAAVRIAMTVAAPGKRDGRLLNVVGEHKTDNEALGLEVSFETRKGLIFPNLQTGVNVGAAVALQANRSIAFRGMYLFGAGFQISGELAKALSRDSPDIAVKYIRPLVNGRDIITGQCNRYVIDFWGLDEAHIRNYFPAAYQHLMDTVKPERATNRNEWRRNNWFYLGDPARTMRPSLADLATFIVTPMTSTHRVFTMISKPISADQGCITICSEDYSLLGTLSSKHHRAWALAAGGWLGVGNDSRYNNSLCFDTFPFPVLSGCQSLTINSLGKEIDTHRKRQQAAHPKLTLTQMYNVLEKLRAGESIEGKDKIIYEQGLIGILNDLHDQIDAAVADAYGWPEDLEDEEILKRLVALNRERALEEAAGHVRWLRPEYQNPGGEVVKPKDTGELALEDTNTTGLHPWPKALPQQVSLVRAILADLGEGDTETVAKQFKGAKRKTVADILESLAALGQARALEDDRYAA